MNLLSKSTILYVNQVRQESFDKLVGKGFSEAFSWRNSFKKIIFLCYSSSNSSLYKKLFGNCFLIGIPFNLSSSTLKSFLNIGINYLKLLVYLIRITRKTQIDIVRMENLLLSGPPVYLLCKLKKIPYVIWLGGYERKSLFFKYQKNIITWILSKLIVLFEKTILKNANFVFPVTDELMELTRIRNVNNKILSPNYVDLSKFKDDRHNDNGTPLKKFNIFYVGRFEKEKGIKVLLNAIKILSDELNNFEVSLIGDGSLKGWMENYVKRNKIKNVKFLGTFSHEEMPKLYNQADIFILPSFTEGSPASLIEAMSCGTASIATSVGLCEKFITNGENGILIPPGDPYKISEAIQILMSDKDLLRKFQKNGRKTILKYTRNYAKIHRYVYEKILNQTKN